MAPTAPRPIRLDLTAAEARLLADLLHRANGGSPLPVEEVGRIADRLTAALLREHAEGRRLN